MKISTLSKFLCTLSVGVVLLLGMSAQTQAQRGNSSRYGRWRARNYGQQVSASRHRRNELRQDLMRHQRIERRTYNASRREQRAIYGDSRDWRVQQRQQRADIRMHQREERGAFKENWKNKGKH